MFTSITSMTVATKTDSTQVSDEEQGDLAPRFDFQQQNDKKTVTSLPDACGDCEINSTHECGFHTKHQSVLLCLERLLCSPALHADPLAPEDGATAGLPRTGSTLPCPEETALWPVGSRFLPSITKPATGRTQHDPHLIPGNLKSDMEREGNKTTPDPKTFLCPLALG